MTKETENMLLTEIKDKKFRAKYNFDYNYTVWVDSKPFYCEKVGDCVRFKEKGSNEYFSNFYDVGEYHVFFEFFDWLVKNV